MVVDEVTVPDGWFVTIHDTPVRDDTEATQDDGAAFDVVVPLLAVVGTVLVARRRV